VEHVLKRYHPRFYYCYERQLAHRPALRGKVSIRFTIVEDGLVRDTGVLRRRATLRDPRVQDCLCAVTRPIRFPKPRSGAVVVRHLLAFGMQR